MPNTTDRDRPQPPICDYEGSTYRIDFWEGQGRDYEDRAERVAIRRLLPPRGGRLMDVGAGFGRLASLYDGFDEVVLVDYSKSQLSYARQRLGGGRYTYVAADLYHLPLVASAIDVTVMVRVMHHLADVPAALAQLARVIVPQGQLVLEFANKRHLKNLLCYALLRQGDPFGREPYEFADLHYDFHPDWIRERLGEAGFTPQKRLSVSLFRLGGLKRTIPTGILVSMDAALQRVSAPLALGPSMFVRSVQQKSGALATVARDQMFACPECACGPLERRDEGMVCPACGRSWPIEDGIYVFK